MYEAQSAKKKTHVFNPSYVLFGSVLFFIGALETYPFLTRNLIPPRWANFLMGFGLGWLMQFHLSWIILVPFLLFSFHLQYRKGVETLSAFAFFGLGATITRIFLVPTPDISSLSNKQRALLDQFYFAGREDLLK